MRSRALGLFLGLPVAGAVLGLVTGELAIGGRNGLYVAPATALVGFLLACMLWFSRSADPGQGQRTAVREEIVRPEVMEPRRSNSVKVNRSGRPGKTGGKG
jgi:hypothetical protein